MPIGKVIQFVGDGAGALHFVGDGAGGLLEGEDSEAGCAELNDVLELREDGKLKVRAVEGSVEAQDAGLSGENADAEKSNVDGGEGMTLGLIALI
jgi:hypothetical protein